MNTCDAFCRAENSDTFRPPPADLDAEGAVLSYAFLHGLSAFPKLAPKHFYADCNRLIFAAMQALAEDEKPIDVLSVAHHLRARGDEHGTNLSRVGGAPYLAALSDCVPASAEPHARAHAARVVELWKRRVLIAAFEEATAKLYALELDSSNAGEYVKEKLNAAREM